MLPFAIQPSPSVPALRRPEVGPLELDRFLGPVGPQQGDRLVQHPASLAEGRTQGLVLAFLPADSDPEADTADGQRIQGADLLGDERRLSLGENQHFDAQADPLRHGADEAERHQWLEDGHLGRIGPGEASLHRMTHDDVIEEIDLVEADRLRGTGDLRDRRGPLAVDDVRKLQCQLHGNSHRSETALTLAEPCAERCSGPAHCRAEPTSSRCSPGPAADTGDASALVLPFTSCPPGSGANSWFSLVEMAKENQN
jgi:hypothetical protein